MTTKGIFETERARTPLRKLYLKGKQVGTSFPGIHFARLGVAYYPISLAKQSRYTPWWRLGGEEV
jgi:hypothetical protein